MNNIIVTIGALVIALLIVKIIEMWEKLKAYKRHCVHNYKTIDFLNTRISEKSMTIANLLRQIKELKEELKEQKREA